MSDDKSAPERFWDTRRAILAGEMEAHSAAGTGRGPLSLDQRLAVVRLMSKEHGQLVRNLSRIVSATQELADTLGPAVELAAEIERLNSQNRLAPLSARPTVADPNEWLRLLERVRREVTNATEQLGLIAPDIIEQIGAIDTSGKKSKK